MWTLPAGLANLIVAFAPLFSKPVFQSVQVLIAGAILATGKRTVTAVLRVMGLSQERHFQPCHRVLNRAAWPSLAASRILLSLLVRAFAAEGPLIFGLDDTIERRWGAKIAARGIYRDPVRSSQSHFVKVTFEEARAHLGIEIQRQWSDKAIARTTPCLFGLYSIVTLLYR